MGKMGGREFPCFPPFSFPGFPLCSPIPPRFPRFSSEIFLAWNLLTCERLRHRTAEGRRGFIRTAGEMAQGIDAGGESPTGDGWQLEDTGLCLIAGLDAH